MCSSRPSTLSPTDPRSVGLEAFRRSNQTSGGEQPSDCGAGAALMTVWTAEVAVQLQREGSRPSWIMQSPSSKPTFA